jgi:uncharacterized protein (DUF362 family)
VNPRQLAVAYGKKPYDLVLALLREMNIASELNPGDHVLLKPNLVMAREASSGITTHPQLVEGVIQYLLEAGVKRITVAESSWTGGDTRRAFRICGYDDLEKKFAGNGIRLLDLKNDPIRTFLAQGSRFKVCRSAVEADYLVNLPVLKGHGATRLTCALKNMKGCIPDSEKRRYHAEGLHEPIAVLNTLIRQNLVIVDGICGDPTSETGGNPVAMDRVILGKDPVLVDSYVAELMGYRPEMIRHIALAADCGVGVMDTPSAQIREIGHPDFVKIPQQGRSELYRLKAYILDHQACSACYGSTLYALQRLREANQLSRLRKKVCVGQGYRGLRRSDLGIGVCTKGFQRFVSGCPPKARDIFEFLQSSLA